MNAPQQPTKESIEPKFLSNTPSGIDLFDSKSQDRTAKTIVDHIKRNYSERKLIGLDGGWGSGKSNVISIVGKMLGNGYHLFIYDTWSHQDDLQRRSFLEALIDKLKDDQKLDEQKWAKKLKDLLSKRKQTETKTIPKISYPVLIFILTIALVPVTRSIAEAFNDINPVIKIVISAFPLMGALIIWIIAAIKDKKYRSLNQLFYIYKEKDIEKITDEVISESEPSITEFRNYLRDVSIDLTSVVLIVFDNMDRLPSQKLQTLWSLIHTFFAEDKFKNIWVIVPFDQSHVAAGFNKDENEAQHFIQKTFPIIFSVSPPVLTDWRKFFEAKFNDAFEKTEDSEFSTIVTIFDRYNSTITPRKIIHFINQLVSLKLIWQNEIPLKYLSLFALNKEKIIQNPESQILTRGFVEPVEALFYNDNTLPDFISALVYNVDVRLASQVFLTRQIEVALRKETFEDLKLLSVHPSFELILTRVVSSLDTQLEMPINRLGELTETIAGTTPLMGLTLIWESLAGKSMKVATNKLEFPDAFKNLLKWTSTHYRGLFLKYLMEEFSRINDFAGKDYVMVVNTIQKYIFDNKLEIDVLQYIVPRKVTPQQLVDIAKASKNSFKTLACSTDNQELNNYFSKQLPASFLDVDTLEWLIPEYDFKPFKDQIEKLIQGEQLSEKNIDPIYKAYKMVSRDKPWNVVPEDNQLDSILSKLPSNNSAYFDCVAHWLSRGSDYTGSYSNDTLITTATEAQIVAISGRVEYFTDYGTLLLRCVEEDPSELLKKVCKNVTENDYGVSTMTIEEVLPHYCDIQKLLDVPHNIFIDRLDGWSQFAKEAITIKNYREVFPDIEFFKYVFSTKNDITDFIAELSFRYLMEMPTSELNAAVLKPKSFELQLAVQVIRHFPDVNVPANLLEAYKNLLDQLMLNTVEVPALDIALWSTIYERLDKRNTSGLAKNIRDHYTSRAEMTPAKFQFMESLLRTQGKLIDKAEDVARLILGPIANELTCVRLMALNKEFYKKLLLEGGQDGLDVIVQIRKIFRQTQASDIIAFSQDLDIESSRLIEVIDSLYTSNRSNVQAIVVTEELRHIIVDKHQINFQVSNETLGSDPDPGHPKTLHITYKFRDESRQQNYSEGDWVSLP